MGRSFPRFLVHKFGMKVRVGFFDVVPDFITEVPDYEYKFSEAGLHQFIHDQADNGLACNGHQRLGLRVGVWTKPSSGTCNGDNYFHFRDKQRFHRKAAK